MKKTAFTLLFAVTFILANAQYNYAKDPFLIKSLKGEIFQKADAETSHGNISVSVVPADEARIEVYIRSNNGRNENLSKEEIQARLNEGYTLDISVTNGTLSAIAKPRRNFDNWKRSLGISFRIYTTQNVATTLRTSHGNIDMAGLEGSQDMATSHGNINIENINGKLSGSTSHGNISIKGAKGVDVSTSHGNIDVTNCNGEIELTTSNGDVRLNKLKGKIHAGTSHGNVTADVVDGELSAKTSHGNIALENLTCSVEASTTHGNISAEVNQVTGSINLNNSDGDISIQLPKGKGIDIDLQGKTIRLDKMENFSGSKTERSMKGSLNGGGEAVKAETGRGTVSLTFK